jgi:hypothetical protein
MKKKTMIILSLIFTVLVGVGITSYVLISDDFSFSNLSVDISASIGLGFGKINTSTSPLNGKKLESNQDSSATYEKLFKVNENGDFEIIRFYNEIGNEIEIPFHPILIENYGDFTYIAYSDWSKEYVGDDNISFTINRLIKDALRGFTRFNFEFIAIHKTTGKVFDLQESFIKELIQSNSDRSGLVYLPDGFAFLTDRSPNDNQVCVNRGTFNESNGIIDVSVVCTDVFSRFTSSETALPNGDIALAPLDSALNRRIFNLYTLDIYNLNSLSLNDPRLAYFSQVEFVDRRELHYLSENQLSWINGYNNVSLFYQNSEFSIIEEPLLNYDSIGQYGSRNIFSSSLFTNMSYYYTEDNFEIAFHNVNPKTLESVEIMSIDLVEDFDHTNLSFHHHFFQDSLFLIKSGEKPFIYEFNLSDSTSSKIFSSLGSGYFKREITKNPNFFLFGEEFYSSIAFTTFKRSGNFYFSVIESLTETTYKFNIYNGQTYQESQSTPTFSYFEITPIN